MAGDFQVRWGDFKGGDWGVRDPSQVDRDQWSGENMLVYRSGLLGTRAALRQLTITGLPNYTDSNSPRGFAAWERSLLLHVGNQIWQVQPDAAAANLLFPDIYAAAPLLASSRTRFIWGNGVLYTLLEGILRKHPFLPGVTSTIAKPAAFAGIVRWGLWMVAFVDPAGPSQRIYFNLVDASGPNYDSWPANNFYDVGNTDPVLSLKAIFNTLYVGKREGWWAVTGVLGDLASVRDVAVGRGPSDDQRAGVGPDSRIMYWSAAEAEFEKNRVPSFFNGADPVATDDTRAVEFDDGFGATAPRSRGDMVMAPATGNRVMFAYTPAPGASKLLMRDGRSWSRHAFPIEIAGLAPNEIREGSQLKAGYVYMAQLRQAGQAPVVAEWRHDTDRPGDADMTTVAGSPRVVGTVSLPAHWEPTGRQMQVKRVIVQFRRWGSAVASTTNRLRLRVDAFGQWGNGTVSSAAQEWSQAASSSPTDGVDDSVRFDFGDQGYGNGFQVVFEAVAGVAIREVVVEVENQRDR